MSTRYFTNSFVRRDQEQYAKKLKMPTGSTAELKRAYLDVNFFNLAEIRALMRKFKRDSGLAIVQVYLAMSAAEEARIDEDALLDILESCDVKCPEEFISYCLEKSLIKLFREKISDESQINPIFPGNETRLPDSDYDYDNEINIKELDTPEIRTWLKKTRERIHASGGTTDEVWVEALLMRYAGRPDELLAVLQHTATRSKTKNICIPDTNQARAGPERPIRVNPSVDKALELAEHFRSRGE